MIIIPENEVRKPYNPELANKTTVKQEWVNAIFPNIRILAHDLDKRNKNKKYCGIDSFWVENTCLEILDWEHVNLSNIRVGIEWEQATQKSWSSYMFPHPNASFLPRKRCYAFLNYPAFFVRINSAGTNGYVHPIDIFTLESAKYSEINRTGESMAIKYECRYSVPIGLIIVGFDCIEPFIVMEYCKIKFKDNAMNKFSGYCRMREKIDKPIPGFFYDQIDRRDRFIKKLKGEEIAPKVEEQLTIFDI